MDPKKYIHLKKFELNKKMTLTLFSVVLMMFISIIGTIAWITTSVDAVQNSFHKTTVSCDILEEFDHKTKTNVRIKNTGTTDAYIRVALVPAWKNSQGHVGATTPLAKTDYDIRINDTDWFLSSDGYYYCKTAIAPDHETPVLIHSCTAKNVSQQMQFELQILASALQSSPSKTVEDCWNTISVRDDGDLEVLK